MVDDTRLPLFGNNRTQLLNLRSIHCLWCFCRRTVRCLLLRACCGRIEVVGNYPPEPRCKPTLRIRRVRACKLVPAQQSVQERKAA